MLGQNQYSPGCNQQGANHEMGWIEILGLLGVCASVAGVALALRHPGHAAEATKHLCFCWPRSRRPRISAKEFRPITITYTGTLGPEPIDVLHENHLIFANLGKQSIKRQDIAPKNPLKVVVEGCRVLDISIDAATREVIQASVGEYTSEAPGVTTAPVTFDYLDHQDGARIRVYSTGAPTKVALKGDIIEMPHGIGEVGLRQHRPFLDRIGRAAALLLCSGALVMAALVYRWITETWANVWLLAVPIVFFLASLTVIAIVAMTIWPEPQRKFPESLVPAYATLLPEDLFDPAELKFEVNPDVADDDTV
jgi:hypothetical protein